VKNVGIYYVKATVAANANYKAATSVVATFKIVPKGTSISSLGTGAGSITATWVKQAIQTTGYQIRYSTNKNMSSAKTITIASPTTVKKTISGLNRNKRYYVQIRTYKGSCYSGWSSSKNILTK